MAPLNRFAGAGIFIADGTGVRSSCIAHSCSLWHSQTRARNAPSKFRRGANQKGLLAPWN